MSAVLRKSSGLTRTSIRAIILRSPLVLGLALVSGCQTSKYTSFAPFSARLEHVPGGGAERFVLMNTSGLELHNYHYTAYVWTDSHLRHPIDRQMPISSFRDSGSKLVADKPIRFKPV